MTLTIFTPTYNRAALLPRGYKALLRQTRKDFIWLIIDDGSTDGTEALVRDWQGCDNGFEIRYVRKENGGLHTGYNKAIELLDTELAVCIDSDDFMPDDAVEVILDYWEKHRTEDVAGIIGLDYHCDGERIGDAFPARCTINLIDLTTSKYRIKRGDRKLVVRSDLYKRVAPQKTFPGEKNFNPDYMHLQISQTYDFLPLNRNLCFVEYQPDGMSARIFYQYRNSPNSFAELRKLYLSFEGTALSYRFRHCIHYVSSCLLAKKRRFVRESPRKLLTVLALPFGALLAAYIRFKTR